MKRLSEKQEAGPKQDVRKHGQIGWNCWLSILSDGGTGGVINGKSRIISRFLVFNW